MEYGQEGEDVLIFFPNHWLDQPVGECRLGVGVLYRPQLPSPRFLTCGGGIVIFETRAVRTRGCLPAMGLAGSVIGTLRHSGQRTSLVQENRSVKLHHAALAALSVALVPAATAVNAATIVQYLGGTTSVSAYNAAPGITGSNISFQSSSEFRASFGGAGVTPAGPTAGTSSGSNWRLWRKGIIADPLTATDNYAGFGITIGAAADGITLGDLAFDLAGGAANGATGGIDVNYQVFAEINSGGFSAVGSPSGFIQLLANNTTNAFSPVEIGSVSLSSLGARSTGDTINIRIAVRSEDSVGDNNIGLFMQGIKLVVVPEPGSLALLGLGGLLVVVGGLRRWRA